MFATHVKDQTYLPAVLGDEAESFWRSLRVVGKAPWFFLRLLLGSNGVAGETHLVALDEDVARLCETNGGELLSLHCIFPSGELAPLGRSEVSMVEVWRAEDRYFGDRACILFVADDGKEYGGHPYTCREGLRRTRLLAKVHRP